MMKDLAGGLLIILGDESLQGLSAVGSFFCLLLDLFFISLPSTDLDFISLVDGNFVLVDDLTEGCALACMILTGKSA